MKTFMRKLCSPVLKIFEAEGGDYVYQPSHRKILIVVGALFTFLGLVCLYFLITAAQIAGLVPGVVFLAVGLVCGIVGLLGNDSAVARIWKNRQ